MALIGLDQSWPHQGAEQPPSPHNDAPNSMLSRQETSCPVCSKRSSDLKGHILRSRGFGHRRLREVITAQTCPARKCSNNRFMSPDDFQSHVESCLPGDSNWLLRLHRLQATESDEEDLGDGPSLPVSTAEVNLCPICFRTFPSRMKLSKHISKDEGHKRLNDFLNAAKCGCGKNFASRPILVEHLRKEHDSGEFWLGYAYRCACAVGHTQTSILLDVQQTQVAVGSSGPTPSIDNQGIQPVLFQTMEFYASVMDEYGCRVQPLIQWVTTDFFFNDGIFNAHRIKPFWISCQYNLVPRPRTETIYVCLNGKLARIQALGVRLSGGAREAKGGLTQPEKPIRLIQREPKWYGLGLDWLIHPAPHKDSAGKDSYQEIQFLSVCSRNRYLKQSQYLKLQLLAIIGDPPNIGRQVTIARLISNDIWVRGIS